MNLAHLLLLIALSAVLSLSYGCWMLAGWLIEEVFTRAKPNDYLFQALLTLPMISLLTMVAEIIARAVAPAGSDSVLRPLDDKGGND
ncbi:hypothetical protein [Ectopseudomonas toyotomiensis]|uniref:hypothetical protein n=1 Tax=Ectopseudomonas toyotomiensis TaxID=554344 RepID=UPI003D0CD027